jgi:hypothetical protein
MSEKDIDDQELAKVRISSSSLLTLAYYGAFFTPFRGYLEGLGVIHAGQAMEALHSGAVVLAFSRRRLRRVPAGADQNVIDVDGPSTPQWPWLAAPSYRLVAYTQDRNWATASAA